MLLFFYNLFLIFYAAALSIASLFNKKARLWLAGRKKIFEQLKKWKKNNGEKIIWMHCASLGEFEQGRPIIEKLRKQYPSYKIFITFFSPSGYEIRKNYTGADGIFYLPLDGKSTAEKFIDILNPSLVVWVKYEYWFYYLTLLKQKNIPVILVSAIFRKNQPFFKWYGNLWIQILQSFEKIFVQNEMSVSLLESIGMAKNIAVTGDTRFDRVMDIMEKNEPLPKALIEFCKDKKVIVAGSTWEEDEEEIVHYAKIHKDIKFIIAPHEIDKERLADIKKLFAGAVFYAEFIAGETAAQTIIIDNIGMLSKLYQLATVAYIGGGFNDSGIHNILEAAVYGKPVVFGPEYERFAEANELVERKGAFSVENALELETLLDKFLNNHEVLDTASTICRTYVNEKRGATEKIMQHIYANRLLTN